MKNKEVEIMTNKKKLIINAFEKDIHNIKFGKVKMHKLEDVRKEFGL